jgi:dipeptidyl aminopeptidase/acylaminoacyl peptidase
MRNAFVLLPVLAGAAAMTPVAGIADDKPVAASPAPLIPRTALFGNPSQMQGRLSPDGKWLAWIAPRDGVLNVWVAPTGKLGNKKALTQEKLRPIQRYFWAPDSKSVLYVNDKGGDENFLLYQVGVADAVTRTLTPFEKTRAEPIAISEQVKDRILIGVNNRDARWHDVHSVDLATGKLKLIFENSGGYAGFLADNSLKLRLAFKSRDDGGSDFFRFDGDKVEAKSFATITMEDVQTTQPTDFTADGKTLYWIDSRGRDTAALIAQDVASGETTVIASNPKADINAVLADPATGKVQAYAVNYLKNEWTTVDPAIEDDFDHLRHHLVGNIGISSRTDDDSLWIVTADPVTGPAGTYLYTRKTKALELLYVNRPELSKATLAPMFPLEIPSRDGNMQVSYLTLPTDSVGDKPGRPAKALPMVLLVHGGPWARDLYGYNGYHQWLANRGYAVLSVNFRGSTGFGKRYISAGDMQWGKKMHDDLIDAVQWAVKEGITTNDKVAIMGGSYGGYATLAGLAFTPDAFACGVDIVGPSNLETLLKTIPAYWEAGRIQLYKRMGDPNTPDGLSILKERSPLYSADKIRKPLLIGQGANDPRVNQSESDQIVKAMEAKNIPVTYVLFPDEGHGFARPENAIAFNAIAEQFLGKCLGGRSEAIGESLKPSSATIPHGREFMPEVDRALGKPAIE